MTQQNRDPNSLSPIFKPLLEEWIKAAQEHAKHVEIFITEARRTKERQAYLYAQGREEPYLHSPTVTWTMDSRHRWGLAADVAMKRRDTGELIWTPTSWEWLYRVCPPEHYGLRHLAPTEWVHLEYYYSDEAIKNADLLDLQQT